MRYHIGFVLALSLICACVGCDSSQSTSKQRIQQLSLQFVAQHEMSDGSTERADIFAALVDESAFRHGMTARQIQDILGEPDSVWENPPDSQYDLRYLYLLDSVSNLEAVFLSDRLSGLVRIVDGPEELGGGRFSISLDTD